MRPLHYYDRLGLLRPGRTGSGYRLYGRQELERLEQIVALKFIGIPLQQIKAILDHNPSSLFNALHIQRTVLEKKRDLLDRAIEALYQAEQSLAAGAEPDAQILKKIIEVIEMQTRNEWIERYYSPEAWTRIKDVHPGWSQPAPKLIDFAFRAVHVTAQTAKRIAAGYYGKPPKRSYFIGCSTGGRQAAIEAQRFPHDFDGLWSVTQRSTGLPSSSRRGRSCRLWQTHRSRRRSCGSLPRSSAGSAMTKTVCGMA